MPAEIDLSKGVRGYFYKPNIWISTPICLRDDTQVWHAESTAAINNDVGQIVNELLKKKFS